MRGLPRRSQVQCANHRAHNMGCYCEADPVSLETPIGAGVMRDLPLSKRPERAILDSQPPGIGGMAV
jgi:hypothetical protein